MTFDHSKYVAHSPLHMERTGRAGQEKPVSIKLNLTFDNSLSISFLLYKIINNTIIPSNRQVFAQAIYNNYISSNDVNILAFVTEQRPFNRM